MGGSRMPWHRPCWQSCAHLNRREGSLGRTSSTSGAWRVRSVAAFPGDEQVAGDPGVRRQPCRRVGRSRDRRDPLAHRVSPDRVGAGRTWLGAGRGPRVTDGLHLGPGALTGGNWSRGGGVPGLLAGEAVERVEHGDAVFGGCGGVGADGGEVSRAFHGAHASGYLLSYLGHPDLPLGRVVVETYGEVGSEA